MCVSVGVYVSLFSTGGHTIGPIVLKYLPIYVLWHTTVKALVQVAAAVVSRGHWSRVASVPAHLTAENEKVNGEPDGGAISPLESWVAVATLRTFLQITLA